MAKNKPTAGVALYYLKRKPGKKDIKLFLIILLSRNTLINGTKEVSLRSYLTLVHPIPFHTASSVERVRIPMSIKSQRPLTLSTQKITLLENTSRHCTHTEISTSTAGIPTVILFGSLDMCVKDVDTSVGEIVLSPRVLGPKSWVGGGVLPIKSHEGVAIEAVAENCQSVSRISKLNPHTELPFIPEMLFV